MNIAVIGAKGLPVKQGGIERHCAEIYPRMVAQGHSVDVFARSSYTGAPWFSSYYFEGVRVISLPSIGTGGLDALFNAALAAFLALTKPYDIVHFHALGPALFCGLPKLISTAGVVVTCHGLDWQRAKWNQWVSMLIRSGERAAAHYAHEIVVVSEALQTYFATTYNNLRTHYIPNGPGRYVASDPTFPFVRSQGLRPGRYILFLGRLVPEKRPDLLIEAFQSLRPSGWKLVIAGGNSDADWFTTRLKGLAAGSEEAVCFIGELHGDRLAEVVRGAGLFVLPSDLEGLPIVMLEAMQEGIPILASDIPPHQQLIGSDRGRLFRAGDVNSCLLGLEQAIKQLPKLQAMARNAQDYVRLNFSWDEITAQNLAIYTKIKTSTSRTGRQPRPKFNTLGRKVGQIFSPFAPRG